MSRKYIKIFEFSHSFFRGVTMNISITGTSSFWFLRSLDRHDLVNYINVSIFHFGQWQVMRLLPIIQGGIGKGIHCLWHYSSLGKSLVTWAKCITAKYVHFPILCGSALPANHTSSICRWRDNFHKGGSMVIALCHASTGGSTGGLSSILGAIIE